MAASILIAEDEESIIASPGSLMSHAGFETRVGRVRALPGAEPGP